MNSIRVHLLQWLVLPILLINMIGAATTYLLAWVPAQVAFDQGLLDAAAALQSRTMVKAGRTVVDLPATAEQMLRLNDVDSVRFQVAGRGGRVLAGDQQFPAPPAGDTGPFDSTLNGEPVRVYFRTLHLDKEEVRIGVASTTRKRAQTRAAIMRIVLVLETLFTVVLAGLIWMSVSRGLLPLERMRAGLSRREAGDLAPVDERDVPSELVPVVAAFNELLGKVGSGTRAQQDFLAEVAHQLRTPLAGTQLQLEWLATQHQNDPDTLRSLSLMRLSNERMIRQSNQLLALARAEPSRVERKRLGQVDVAELVSQVVQYFVVEAGKKRIDIGFELQRAPVAGDAFLLRDLIDNLIDNAVRYTPDGGTVTVSCGRAGGRSRLRVVDSGPGIAPARRAEAFQRHVRLSADTGGSGLGLAIVRDVAHVHGATVTLSDAPGRSGLVATVVFPRA